MTLSKFWCLAIANGALVLSTPCVYSQVSLTTIVDFALRNSPKVKQAQADLDKARAGLAEAHDAYIPAVTTGAGYGVSSGVPLSLPVVFSMSAQSLVFNFSQKDYVRAAASGVAAATLALNEARNDVAEDAVTNYVSLDNALQRSRALAESSTFATSLVRIVQDRFDTGIEPRVEVTRSRRTIAQLKLQRLIVDDEIASRSDHLARVTGTSLLRLETIPASIPSFTPPSQTAIALADSDGVKAMFANAATKLFVARGDARYRLRPQIAFSAGYSRISTYGTNYILYYPGFDPARHPQISYNSFDLGVQITIPILDLVHQAKARGSAAEASRAHFEAESQRIQFLEGRYKLQHVASELEARAELASLDRDVAQDQLETIQLQLKAGAGTGDGPQMTPKDEQNARLQERQKYVEFLDSDLQLRQTQVSWMRQSDQLGDWLHRAIINQGGTPAPDPSTQAVPAPQP